MIAPRAGLDRDKRSPAMERFVRVQRAGCEADRGPLTFWGSLKPGEVITDEGAAVPVYTLLEPLSVLCDKDAAGYQNLCQRDAHTLQTVK